ncbi:MAG: hypothetical protein VYB55_02910 [Bacteroidota bacterium]|nr:hypothetical protein [Bacteroidota bacterium]
MGLGHVYNTLLIANDILNHQITFLVDNESELALKVIQSKNYPVFMQQADDIMVDIKKLDPDIVINDRLDTTREYVMALNKAKYRVVNFEDLGEGSQYANIVFNAIYPKNEAAPSHYFGQDYFILRDEFILSKEKTVKKEVKNILIAFGGVDPNNYTEKVIKTINDYCSQHSIGITVIAGFGYDKYDTINSFPEVKIEMNVSNISDYMLEADLIFTSAGRTVYEIASIGTPAIIMGQNRREMTHFFASKEYGFSNLGLGSNVSVEELLQEFIRLINSFDNRKQMSDLMKKQDLRSGRKKVHSLIQDLINK